MRLLVGMLLLCSVVVFADEDDGLRDWTSQVELGSAEDIAEPPRTYVEINEDTGKLRFTIYNHTSTTFRYSGYSRKNAQLFFAKRENRKLKSCDSSSRNRERKRGLQKGAGKNGFRKSGGVDRGKVRGPAVSGCPGLAE